MSVVLVVIVMITRRVQTYLGVILAHVRRVLQGTTHTAKVEMHLHII